MNVRILSLALMAFGLSACVAPGPRYHGGYDSHAYEDRGYVEDRGYEEDRAYDDRRHDDRDYADNDRRYDERHDNNYRSDGYRNFASCANCGVVQRIEGYADDRRSSGAGVVAGVIIGGVLGNQVGSGSGRRAATVAGAIGGGIAGHAIERNMNHASYDITVRLNNRRDVVVTQDHIEGMREGSRVIVQDGRAQLL
jgi:outer membrane lipoprotein SlyB